MLVRMAVVPGRVVVLDGAELTRHVSQLLANPGRHLELQIRAKIYYEH